MGGIGIYTQEIVRALLRIDRANEYILIYPGFGAARKFMGQFHHYKNATEIEAPLPLGHQWQQISQCAGPMLRTVRALLPVETYWDQMIVPRVAEQYRVDVLFNPHLTVPIKGRFSKVAIIHAVEYHTVPNVYTWRMYAWWFLLEKLILPAADRVISLSNTMTEAVQRHVKYPISRVRTIYHGVSEKFRVETDGKALASARARYGLPERFILFVGRLYPEKNFATLLRAFADLNGARSHKLVVAGAPRYKVGPDMTVLRQLGLEDRVSFLGHVPHGDLPLIYNLAEAFVNPSLYEGFGLAQIEAMACGCPVIAANTGAIPEVTGGAALLFNPHDPAELSQAIIKAIGDASFRGDLVQRGLARAAEFTWERAARATLEVFQELV